MLNNAYRSFKFVCLFFILFFYVSYLFGAKSIGCVEGKIQKISTLISGEIGVAVKHIENGRWIEFNGFKRFPMASTYKLPIAVYCLSLIDQGRFGLKEKVGLTKYDFWEHSHLTSKVPTCGEIKISIKKLIKAMISCSDNVASDKILQIVGGPSVVTEWLQRNGFEQISINRTALKMRVEFNGINWNELNQNYYSPQSFSILRNKVSRKTKLEAMNRFFRDLQDTTTPVEMVHFLSCFYNRKIIGEYSTNFLLESMKMCRCAHRLKGLLPKGTKVWHKTGTLDGAISDIGVIELPKNKGHLAIAVYTSKSMNFSHRRERAIACIARIIFNYFA